MNNYNRDKIPFNIHRSAR